MGGHKPLLLPSPNIELPMFTYATPAAPKICLVGCIPLINPIDTRPFFVVNLPAGVVGVSRS